MTGPVEKRPASLTTAWLVLAVAIVAVSMSALFVRTAQGGASSLAIAAWRTLIAAAIVTAWTVPRRRTELARLSRRDVVAMAVSGVCLAVHFASWIGSLAWTSVAVSVTLVNTAPLFVATIGPLTTGERPTARALAGAVIATAGAAAIGLSAEAVEGRNDLWGAGLAILGAVSVAGYLLVGRDVRDRMPLDVYVTGVYGVSAVTLMTAALAMGETMIGFGATSWAGILGLAIVCQIIGHTATNFAVRGLSTSTVSTVLLAEPVLASAAAFWWLGERVAAAQLAGAVLVLIGIILAARGERRVPVAAPTVGGDTA